MSVCILFYCFLIVILDLRKKKSDFSHPKLFARNFIFLNIFPNIFPLGKKANYWTFIPQTASNIVSLEPLERMLEMQSLFPLIEEYLICIFHCE